MLWSRWRADPNGYYTALGLDREHPWLMLDIKKAHRELVSKYHPDGPTPDRDKFEKTQCAYEVIGDPLLRAAYDKLTIEEVWPDRYTIELIIKKLTEAGFTVAGEPEEIIETMVSQAVEDVSAFRPELDDFVVYYYEEDELPTKEEQWEWIGMIQRALWMYRVPVDTLRVGFSNRIDIVDEGFGDIFMVAGKPDEAAATYLAIKAFRR